MNANNKISILHGNPLIYIILPRLYPKWLHMFHMPLYLLRIHSVLLFPISLLYLCVYNMAGYLHLPRRRKAFLLCLNAWVIISAFSNHFYRLQFKRDDPSVWYFGHLKLLQIQRGMKKLLFLRNRSFGWLHLLFHDIEIVILHMSDGKYFLSNDRCFYLLEGLHFLMILCTEVLVYLIIVASAPFSRRVVLE